MVTRPEVNVEPTTDEDRAIATLTMAFSDDPVARWAFRDPGVYLTYWPQLVRVFGGARSGRARPIPSTTPGASHYGSRRVSHPTKRRWEPSRLRRCRQPNRKRCSASWRRWVSTTPPNRTGISRSSASTSPNAAGVSDRHYCGMRSTRRT